MIKQRKSNPSIVVIVDGKDEKWYLEKVREHYNPEVLRKTKIVPELARKKKVAQLFAEAEVKVKSGCTTVILIIDFDDVGKDKSEFDAFKMWYKEFMKIKSPVKNEKVSKKYKWMEKLELIVNSPCIEYWYMLHFINISRYYPNYDQMKNELKAIPELKNYDKDRDYYNRHPDIYLRLNGDDGLKTARNNSQAFSLEECKSKGGSEMYKFFDFVDGINI